MCDETLYEGLLRNIRNMVLKPEPPAVSDIAVKLTQQVVQMQGGQNAVFRKINREQDCRIANIEDRLRAIERNLSKASELLNACDAVLNETEHEAHHGD